MTQDEIIRMAREAGGVIYEVDWCFEIENLERFAALVASNLFTYDQVKAHIQAAVITEREECAKVCESFKAKMDAGIEHIAAAIRERSANARARGEK